MEEMYDKYSRCIEEYLENISNVKKKKENIIDELIIKYRIDSTKFEELLKEECIREYVKEKKKEIEKSRGEKFVLDLCMDEKIRKKGINEEVKAEISRKYNIGINIFEQWRDEIIVRMFKKGITQSKIAEELGLNQSTISRVINAEIPKIEQRMILRSDVIPIKVQKDIYNEVFNETLVSYEDEWNKKMFRECIKRHLIKSGKDLEEVNNIIKNRRIVNGMYSQFSDYPEYARDNDLKRTVDEEGEVDSNLNKLQKDYSLVLVDCIKFPEDKYKQERFLVIARAENCFYHELITIIKNVNMSKRNVSVEYKFENIVIDFFKRVLKEQKKDSIFIISKSSKEQLDFNCDDFRKYLIPEDVHSDLIQSEYEKENMSLIDDIKLVLEEYKEEISKSILDDIFEKYRKV